MKKIVFFITHKTLELEHADLTFQSLSNQNTDVVFDRLYIYNTHQNELSNDTILELYNKYNLNRIFKEVVVFDYDPSTHKSLGGDISAIKTYCISNYERLDRILLLKSDILLSKNYFDEINNIHESSDMIYFVAPLVCAKKRVANEEIISYSLRDNFIRSDEITFFVEDQNQSGNNDFNNRPGVDVLDEAIKFTSCYVIRDFSCHYFSIGLFERVSINLQSWGGIWFESLRSFLKETSRCFTIHKYHDIKSENRAEDREGPVESWLTS